MMNSKKRKRTGFLLILPLLILFLGLTIYPLIYMIYMSFHQYSLASWEEPRFIGWENYREILRDRTASSSVSFTLFLLFTAVPLEILLGIGIAFLIRDVWGERALRSSLIIPMTIPPVVAGIAWKMLYNYEFGPINYFLSLFGLPKVSWLGSQFFARLGVLLIDVAVGLPLYF